MNVIIYCRVSSENQKENLSLHVQEEVCKNHCLLKDWKINWIIKEVASSTKISNQKELLSLVDLIPSDPTILLIYNVSRFSRNVVQGLQFADTLYHNGIVLESTMEDINFKNPSGRFNFIQLLNNAELESKMLSKRISDALRQKKLEGNRLGKIPFGFKIDSNINDRRTFIPHQKEYKIVELILACKLPGTNISQINKILRQLHQGSTEFVNLELYNQNDDIEDDMVIVDGLKFSNIADILNDYQLLNRGKHWNSESIRNVWLHNKK